MRDHNLYRTFLPDLILVALELRRTKYHSACDQVGTYFYYFTRRQIFAVKNANRVPSIRTCADGAINHVESRRNERSIDNYIDQPENIVDLVKQYLCLFPAVSEK